MKSVFHASLLFLHFRLGGSTNVNYCNTTCQLGKAFLKLFAVVIGSGFFDLTTNLLNATLDLGSLSGTLDHNGVLLVDGDALSLPKIGELNVLELDAQVLGNATTSGKDSYVAKHFLATIAETGSLYCTCVQGSTQLVDHQGCQSFTLDVLSDDQERLAFLGNKLKERKKVVESSDLLFVDQDVAILKGRFHGFVVGAEVGAKVTLVELHAFNDFQGSLDGFRFLYGDGAVLADLIHCIGDDVTDFLVPVGGNGGDLAHFLAVGNLLAVSEELGDSCLDGLVDASLEVYGIGAGGHVLNALAINAVGQHGGGSGTVTCGIGSLGCYLANHLRAHVFVGIR